MKWRGLSAGAKAFGILNYGFLLLLGFVTLFPFWYVLITSFSDPVMGTAAYFWPKDLYTANYWLVFTTKGLGQAYLITMLRVITAVPLMLVVTGAAAFALTRKELIGRKIIIIFFFVTMFFSGGLIPYYLLLKSVGLINSFLVYVIPAAFSVWTMIVMKTAFQSLPEGLVEAAIIDGASYTLVFFRIIVPLSLPMIATLGLFSAVGHWNDWFTGAFFVQDADLKPLQTFLQFQVLKGGAGTIYSQVTTGGYFTDDPWFETQLMKITPKSLEAAYIVVSTVPLLLVYPWIQKYFVKGVLVGSIKE